MERAGTGKVMIGKGMERNRESHGNERITAVFDNFSFYFLRYFILIFKLIYYFLSNIFYISKKFIFYQNVLINFSIIFFYLIHLYNYISQFFK